jgi:hypothetical protein
MNIFFKTILGLFSISMLSCSSNDVKTIANKFCDCRQVEMNQGALQANKCFEEWDKKYGKVSLNESEQNTFLEITKACNPKSN